MRLRPDEQLALNSIAGHWWRGPDPGVPATVAITLRVPSHRSDEEVLDLFRDLVEALSAGHEGRVSLKRSAADPD